MNAYSNWSKFCRGSTFQLPLLHFHVPENERDMSIMFPSTEVPDFNRVQDYKGLFFKGDKNVHYIQIQEVISSILL